MPASSLSCAPNPPLPSPPTPTSCCCAALLQAQPLAHSLPQPSHPTPAPPSMAEPTPTTATLRPRPTQLIPTKPFLLSSCSALLIHMPHPPRRNMLGATWGPTARGQAPPLTLWPCLLKRLYRATAVGPSSNAKKRPQLAGKGFPPWLMVAAMPANWGLSVRALVASGKTRTPLQAWGVLVLAVGLTPLLRSAHNHQGWTLMPSCRQA